MLPSGWGVRPRAQSEATPALNELWRSEGKNDAPLLLHFFALLSVEQEMITQKHLVCLLLGVLCDAQFDVYARVARV